MVIVSYFEKGRFVLFSFRKFRMIEVSLVLVFFFLLIVRGFVEFLKLFFFKVVFVKLGLEEWLDFLFVSCGWLFY